MDLNRTIPVLNEMERSELLNEIYRAKAERRKRLAQLPVDERIVLVERLRDMAVALRAARHELARKR